MMMMIMIIMSDDDCFLVDFCNFIITVVVVAAAAAGGSGDSVLSPIPTLFHFSSCSSAHNPRPHSLFVIYNIQSTSIVLPFLLLFFLLYISVCYFSFSLFLCGCGEWNCCTSVQSSRLKLVNQFSPTPALPACPSVLLDLCLIPNCDIFVDTVFSLLYIMLGCSFVNASLLLYQIGCIFVIVR
ncbi:unnamed protein product [Trichobilharzia szidati]|nr:unnamed protein product [Trichobilharzia szidati]